VPDVTASNDDALTSMVASVRDAFEWGGFVQEGITLVRHTDDGVVQFIYFYRGWGGAPPDQGGEPDHVQANGFKVVLAARLSGQASAHRRAFPKELDVDIDVGVGEPKRLGADPDFRIDMPAESVARIFGYLEPYGRRWFQRYESVERAVKTLEALHPSDYARAGDFPALVAMRLRAARGELDGARQNLARLIGSRSWPPQALSWLTNVARDYGVLVE
jgi:hypothetical protein